MPKGYSNATGLPTNPAGRKRMDYLKHYEVSVDGCWVWRRARVAELKRQGKVFGRPRVVNETLAARLKREFKTNSATRLSEKYGISKSAVYNAIKA